MSVPRYLSALIILIVLIMTYVIIFSQGIMKRYDNTKAFATSWVQVFMDKTDTHRTKMLQRHMHGNQQTKRVVLFCYMRGGSTFFSELFSQNKEVMYWYEPYDAFYSAFFGEKTWHFPQDIFWYQHSPGNSLLRHQSERELTEMAKFNYNLLHCNFDKLPVELLYHGGLTKSNLQQYRQCQQVKAKKGPAMCRQTIRKCSGNSHDVLVNKCPENIYLAQKLVAMGNISNTTGVKQLIDPGFITHARCVSNFRSYIKPCIEILNKKCKLSNITTYKGLRINMRAIESMLQLDPDLLIVYFVRDPRATASSRVKIRHTYRDTKNSPVLESKYLCAKMIDDLEIYDRLYIEYPTSILLVKYEDTVTRTNEEVRRIYNFFGMDVHQSVLSWISRNQNTTVSGGVFSTKRQNSTASIYKWRYSVSSETAKQMTLHCKDVLIRLNYTL